MDFMLCHSHKTIIGFTNAHDIAFQLVLGHAHRRRDKAFAKVSHIQDGPINEVVELIL